MTEVPVVIGRVDRLIDIVFRLEFDVVVVVVAIVGRMSKRKVRALQIMMKGPIWSLMELSVSLLSSNIKSDLCAEIGKRGIWNIYF